MKKFFVPAMILFFLAFFSGPLFSAGIGFKIQTTVATPTIAEMKIIPWENSDTLQNKIIDFNTSASGTPLPGKNSVSETPDDGWTAKTANVGFDLLCIGPPGSKLYISCGELSDGAGHTIHHKDTYTLNNKTYVRKNFGVTVTRDYSSPPATVYNDAHRTGPADPGTLIDNFVGNEIGHLYHIYNWLNIPAETFPGSYSTNSYLITFII